MRQHPPSLTVLKELSAMYLQNKYTKCYYNIIDRAKSRVLPKETYTEKHHIIPKSLGGSNDQTNIAKLTAREHFICHLLLPKMLTGVDKRNMIFALWSMLNRDNSTNKSRYKINSRIHESIRKQISDAASQLHKGKVVSDETKAKMSASAKGRKSPFKGHIHSVETKQKLSIINKDKTLTKEHKAKIIESRKYYRHSEETKKKISEGNKGKITVVAQETRQKISETLKGRVPTWLVGKTAHNNGIAHSSETKEKISTAAKNRERFTCPHCEKSVPKCNFTRWHGENCKNKS